MLSLCHYLLYLYPAAHRLEYGEEMMDVLREKHGETRSRGAAERWTFCAREIGGLLCGALQEQIRGVTGCGAWGVIHMRKFTTHSEFRFPKVTPWLMTVILAGVVMTIEKAKAIQDSVSASNAHGGPIQAVQFTFLTTVVTLFLIGCVMGAVGWAILFALRRSGVQRLSELRPSGGERPGGGFFGKKTKADPSLRSG
jgi:hypothetical protein